MCPAQTLAHRALQPGCTVCIPWGRGTGKSQFTRLVWYLHVLEHDGLVRAGGTCAGVRIVLMMPTLKQAKKVHGQLMSAELAPGGEWGFLGGKINHSDWRVTFPGGSWIQWVSAENANDNRGIRCDIACADEADDIDAEILSSIAKPWFSEPWSMRKMLIGGTPRRGRNGLLYTAYRTWPKQSPHNHFAFHATAHDAPRLVDPAYLADIKLTTPPEIWRREWLCDFDSAEGLVYAMFDEDFHVREPDYGLPWTEILVGVDHGWEDPGVILVAGVQGTGREATIHLLEEVYAQHHETSWWVERAVEVAGRYKRFRQRWYADPSRPDRVVDMKQGIRAAHDDAVRFQFEETDNSIEAGVDAVADRIARRQHEDKEEKTVEDTARLYVSPRCKDTIREFGTYRRKRDPRNADRMLDDILDKDNHAMDALRYLTVSRFGRPERRRYEYQPPPARAA